MGTARFLINTKQKLGLITKKRQKPSSKKENWQEKLADELHKPLKRKFTRRRVVVNEINKIWSADLVFIDKLSKWNQEFKYTLTVICFWQICLGYTIKNKTGILMADSFKQIVNKSQRKPKYLWVDDGSEFYNKPFRDWLNKNNINMYSTFNEGKAVVIERFNRTLKKNMYKQFTTQNNTIWYNILNDLINKYNNTKHSSIKTTPVEASNKKNRGIVYFNLYGDMEPLSSKLKFKVGDKVRISKYKRKVFDKGFTPNWSEEIFIVDKIQYTNPITYKIKDLNNEEIKGSFYEPELLKAKQDIFRIDKVIKRDYKKKQALVKWKGYSDDFNSWMPLKDLRDL